VQAEQVVQQVATPLTAPAFPLGRFRFTDREYFNVVYRTEADALRAVVPEPLEIDEPLVRFEIMHMGDVEGYGPYTESGQAIPVRLGEERGEYLHAMYLDNFPATAAGRELSAYPKTAGSPRLYVEQGTLVGILDIGSLRVATATMGYKHRPMDLAEAERQLTLPNFMLKVVPGYDARPRVCELVRTRITDIVVKQAWTGPARLQLFQHALAPLADLPVLAVAEASHVITDLTLAPAQPVYDYLKETS
jgi:acetoacetate decarboxylase